MDFVNSQNCTSNEHILMLFRIHLELLLVQHCMVVQILLCLHTQPFVMLCMYMYVMHVLNSMNNHNRSNMLYFKAWIIWNKSLLSIYSIFNFFQLLIYQWKLNNKITNSCMAKYNHMGYLTILYSIGTPSFIQLIHQRMLIWPLKISCTKICLQIHLYKKIHQQYWKTKSNLWIMCFIFFHCRRNTCKNWYWWKAFFKYECGTFHSKILITFWHAS